MNLIKPRPRVTVEGLSKSGNPSPKGLVKHREHWDGHVDAKALPAQIRVKAKPSWGQWLRFLELEDAAAEKRRAQMSGDTEAIRRASYRLERARGAFESVKFRERVVEAIHVQQS